MRYLNDVEDRMSGCDDPTKILMGTKAGRKAYAAGGGVGDTSSMLGRMGRGIRRGVDRTARVIKEAMMSTKPKDAMSMDAQKRGDMKTGPAYKKGGRVGKMSGGLTCKNQGSAPNAEKGMAKKMGLAAGGVGKIRHEQYK